jgi:hypothetical protein
MIRFLLSMIGFGILMGTGILVMIHGWGLEPQSWGWIIGGGAAGTFLGACFQLADWPLYNV